jgi:hypothetical protein
VPACSARTLTIYGLHLRQGLRAARLAHRAAALGRARERRLDLSGGGARAVELPLRV